MVFCSGMAQMLRSVSIKDLCESEATVSRMVYYRSRPFVLR
jgi:hypothetical protein